MTIVRPTIKHFLYGLLLTINGDVMADSVSVLPDSLHPNGTDALDAHSTKYAYGMDKPHGWILGAGIVVLPNPFVGDAKTLLHPFPMLGYFGEKLTWMGPMISYNLYRAQTKPVAIDVMTNLRFEGFDEDQEDPLLLGLKERDSTYEFGFLIQSYMLSLSALTDVSDTHNGHEFSLIATQHFQITNKLGLDVSAGTVWRSGRLNNYYYGVNNNETTLFRPEYQAGSGRNYRMGLKLDYYFNKHWMLMTNVNYDWLSDEITNSPIVGNNYQYSLMAALIYRFGE